MTVKKGGDLEISLLIFISLAVLSFGNFLNRSVKGLSYAFIYQLVTLLVYIVSIKLEWVQKNDIGDYFFLSSFFAPIFIEEKTNIVKILLLPAVFLFQKVFSFGPEESFLGISMLVLLFGLSSRKIFTIIFSTILGGVCLSKALYSTDFLGMLSPLLVLGALYGMQNYGESQKHLRLYFFILLVFTLIKISETSPVVQVISTLFLIIYTFISSEKLLLKCSILSVLLVGLNETNGLIIQIPIYTILLFISIELLKQLFLEFLKIKFSDGALTISYGQVVFLFISILALCGVYPSPLSWGQGAIGGILTSFTVLVLFFSLATKELIFSIREAKKDFWHKEILISVFLFIGLVLFLTYPQEYFSFNLFGAFSILLVITILFLTKKELINLRQISGWIEPKTIYPRVFSESVELSSVLAKKTKFPNALSFSFPRYSYSISVGITFLMISLVFWGLLA